jgi:hypothetical protein
LLTLHRQEVLRNPWTWLAALVLPWLSLAFIGRSPEVALLSLYGGLLLFLPPVVSALSVPLLARQEEWAFWAAMPAPPGHLYRAGMVGVGLGLSVVMLAGLGLSGIVLQLSLGWLALLTLAALAVLWLWVGIAGLCAAILDPGRALGAALGLWGVLVLAYSPLVVGLAVAWRHYPLEPLLLAALLVNPLELLRVALLQALEVPVLVGPVGHLLTELLGGSSLAWAALAFGVWGVATFGLAGLIFARRDR